MAAGSSLGFRRSWQGTLDVARTGPSSLRALYEVDPDMCLNIEHEDTELGQIEGLQVAADVLKLAWRTFEAEQLKG